MQPRSIQEGATDASIMAAAIIMTTELRHVGRWWIAVRGHSIDRHRARLNL